MSNLWDVTDRDIDRFLKDILETWLSNDASMEQTSANNQAPLESDSQKQKSLLDIIPRSRDVCRLPYLIGSAPVVYGIPVMLKSGKSK